MKCWLHFAAVVSLSSLAGLLNAADSPPLPYLKVLPADAAARAALAAAPQIQIAQQQREQGEAQAMLQSRGAHEWVFSSTLQQRETMAGVKYHEEDVALSRTFRWLGKAGMDRSLGEKIAETAGFAFEDAWHESGRNLLGQWFDWLRASSEARLLAQQLTLFEAQLATAEKRVVAGDAPRIELQLAQTELARAQAAQIRAQQNAELLTLNLRTAFPQLELNLPAELDTPADLTQDDNHWIRQVVDNNHEIELVESEAEVSKLAAQRAQRDRMADPSIGVRYAREFDAQEHIVGITFSMPFGGASRENTYAVAQAEARRMQKVAEQVRLNVERDARTDVLAVHSGIRQWRLLATLAEQARTNADTAARAYELGEYSLTETQVARRQALDSAMAAQTAHLDALQAQARLWLDAHQLWSLRHDHEHESDQATGTGE